MSCTTTCVKPSPSQAHCGACHVTFGGVSGFDRHRRDGQCLTPDAIGHTDNGRGVFRAPLDDRQRARLAALNPDAPSASRREPQAADHGLGVVPVGVAISRPAETLSDGEAASGPILIADGTCTWHWTPTATGSYSGPHGPDICPAIGCRHDTGGAA